MRSRQKKPAAKPQKKRLQTPDFERDVLYAYTDGSTSRANPGPVLWAVVFVRNGEIELLPDGSERIDLGGERHGSNIRAELLGVIRALELERHEDLIIVTDLLLIVHCVNGVWKRSANRDLWDQFEVAWDVRARKGLRTEVRHVKGHGGDPFNCLADKLAAAHGKANLDCAEASLHDALRRNSTPVTI